MAQPLLEARNLGRMSADRRWLLRAVSINLNAGESLAVIGPSGSGKTLLLRTLALLDEIDEGELVWNGQPIENDAVPRFRRQVIYLHQRPVLSEGTVESNLRLPFTFRIAAGEHFDRDWITEQLHRLGREAAILTQPARQLSGGEAQIVALLRAVQLKPAVLLLDEPTAAMDAESAAAVEQLVTGWLNEPGTERAMIWVSHDADQIGRVTRQTLHLNARAPAESAP